MKGIERIKKMLEGQQDEALKTVGDYLISREDLEFLYRNGEKSIKQMAQFIQASILTEMCKKADVKDPKQLANKVQMLGQNTQCLMVGMKEESVFELAIKYFEKSNKDLGIQEEKKNKVDVPKEESKEDDIFGSIFENITETAERKQEDNKDKKAVEQINLFETSIFAA